MMMMKSEKDDMPKMATKSYSYGGRVAAAGSMEKPEKREMQEGGMMMTPRKPYTTKEEEQKRKEEAMSFMPSIMKKIMR